MASPLKNVEKGFSRFVSQRREKIADQYLLMKELIRDPRDMGTLFPSSDALADEMAFALSPTLIRSGLLVELGAGTGPVTEALLRHGVDPRQLVVVEKSESLAESLKERFSGVLVLCCGAEELRALLPTDQPVRAIISSLPFRSLPQEVSLRIMHEVDATLAPGGLFVQFTYALFGEMPFVPRYFRKIRSHVVLYNIPPAKVEVFRKPKAGGLDDGMGER